MANKAQQNQPPMREQIKMIEDYVFNNWGMILIIEDEGKVRLDEMYFKENYTLDEMMDEVDIDKLNEELYMISSNDTESLINRTASLIKYNYTTIEKPVFGLCAVISAENLHKMIKSEPA